MTIQEAADYIAKTLGAVSAELNGAKVEISAINGDEVTYRFIKRGRPKFLKAKFSEFTNVVQK